MTAFANFNAQFGQVVNRFSKDVIIYSRVNEEIVYQLNPALKQEERKELIDVARKKAQEELVVIMHEVQQVFKKGPKILELDNVDFEQLEQTTLNLTIKEYAQPFESMVVLIPKEYGEKKLIPAPWRGTDTYPLFCIVHWHKKLQAISISTCMKTNDFYSVCLSGKCSSIEEEIEEFKERNLSVADTEISINVTKAVLNACLYATFGLKNLGPENPSHYSRLQRRKNEKELRSHPFVYTFEQRLSLTLTLRKNRSEDSDGREVAPHWRKGHWRHQRYGVGLQEVKRIHIGAILVNSHLFKGELVDTKVTIGD